jgi:multidrug efflux pump subunit AcrA (membrane-fusion protein)
VQIERVNPKITATSRVTIPIAAIKVEAERVTVFTVNPDSTVTPHEVTLGALLGDRVEITQGLTGDMMIITDARGLREGQKVEVK